MEYVEVSAGFLSHVIVRLGIYVETILSVFGKSKGWKGRSGGYFCLINRETGRILMVALVGSVPLEKAKRYLTFAIEKAVRLFSYSEHKTSWESRDPIQNKWGGAVAGKHYILSFSGFPEKGDTVLMLRLLKLIEDPTSDTLEKLAKLGGCSKQWERFKGY